MFGQGAFQIDPNATPDQIKRKREILAEMILGQGRPQYVGEGLADGVAKAFAGWQTGKINKHEREASKKASDAFTAMLGQTPAPTGPLSVLGMDPSWGEATPFAAQPDQPFGIEAGAAPGAAAPIAPKPFGITPGAAPGAAFSPDALVEGLVQRGLPRHVAEGFAMNAEDESGFNPGINEAAPVVPGSRGGFGLMQWTGPRRKALEAFAAQRGASVADPNVQMDFLVSELQGPESGAAQSILSAQDAGSAGAAIVTDFLRPAPEHRARRVAEYTGGAAAPTGGPQAAMAGFQMPAAPAYNGPPVAALRAALANPWLDDASKQVAAQLLEEAERATDPMRAIQMQQAQMGIMRDQAELSQIGQPEQMTPYQQAQVELAQQRLALDQQGGGQTEYGLTPQYGVDANGNPTIIQIGKDGTATKTAMPEGVQFQKEPIRLDAGTHWVLLDPITRQPVGQVPKEIAQAAAQQEIGKAQGANEAAAIAGLPDAISQADQAIALATAIRDDPALEGITGMVQGRLPPLGQAATDLNVKIEQARGKVFVEAFEGLKGGGAITEREGEAATRAIARMDRVQSHEAYVEALNELIGIVDQGRRRAMEKAGVQPPAAAVDDDDALLRKYGG